MIKKALIFLLLCISTGSLAETLECSNSSNCERVRVALENVLSANVDLLEKAKRLESILSSTPNLELEPLSIVIDKDGRVFVKDTLSGTLKIGELSYAVSIKIKTTIIKDKQEHYGFNLKFKAGYVITYELDDSQDLRTFASPALVIEPFYYKNFSANFLIGPRIYGPAIGMNITEHFSGLAGVGFKYNDEKAFLLGGAFDF